MPNKQKSQDSGLMNKGAKFSCLSLCGQHSVNKHMAFMVFYDIYFHALTIHYTISNKHTLLQYIIYKIITQKVLDCVWYKSKFVVWKMGHNSSISFYEYLGMLRA
jgi:hypothetical protein